MIIAVNSNCFLEQQSTQERSPFWFARKTIKCHSEISTLAKLTHVSLLLRKWYLVSACSSGGRHDIIVTHVSMKYVPKDDWVLFGSPKYPFSDLETDSNLFRNWSSPVLGRNWCQDKYLKYQSESRVTGNLEKSSILSRVWTVLILEFFEL